MKQILSFFLTSLLLFLLSVPCAAQEYEETEEEQSRDFVEEQLHDLGREFEDTLPPESRESLEALDLTELNLSAILSLTPQAFCHAMKTAIENQWKMPIHTVGKILGILLLCTLLFTLKDSLLHNGLDRIFSVVSVVCILSLIAKPLTECISKGIDSLYHCSLFLLSYIPVLSGVLVANGQAAAASGYHFLLFAACQIVSQLSTSLFVPLLGIYFSFVVIAGAFPQMGLQNIAGGIKSLLSWGLGGVTTIFVGLFSLQTLVTSNVDSLTMKTSKFILGNFIPVVGGALSDAFSAAHGCVTLVKNTVGTFGILVAVSTILPILLEVVLWYLLLWLSAQIGTMLGVKEVSSVLKGAADTVSILMAMLLCYGLLLIISTAIVMILGSGR